ncbi:hypothetical protein [Candidatus Methanomassiliicoccus intestinalis]|uniref:hypothetical protein n=1 Tax=Candidatus Methanomassiliicoccus intestinalis TaxID=1406512 RepID=UPI0037DDC3AC
MNKKSIIAIVVIILAVAAVAVAVFALQDSSGSDGDGMKEVNATIYIDSLGAEESSTGFGNTIASLLASAFPNRDIKYSSNGSIASVDGVANTDKNTWAIFKWASPDGWEVLSSSANSKIKLPDGVSLALHYAEKTKNDQGKIVYTAPDIDVEYKVYFFLQFKEGYDANDIILNILTEQERKDGFWIEGTGEDVIECLSDAVYTYLLHGDYTDEEKKEILSYDERRESYGWLNKFLGWEDKRISTSGGEFGTWTYWSQYTYDHDAKTLDDASEWNYNQLSIGQYDITEDHYFALILQTTTVETVNIPIPTTPADIPAGL